MWDIHPNRDFLEDLWVLFSSLRNGASLLHGWLADWLLRHISFVDPQELPSAEQSQPMWAALGLRADLIERVAVEWQVLWQDDRLKISEAVRGQPTIYQDISDTILAILTL
eukprot:11183987-Lingulodinium_polyedra.AAC.1